MSTRTRIKFCGLARPEDVDEAVALGVDMIGLVFAVQSPRRLELSVARQLRERIPASIRTVALFMDSPREQIETSIAAVQPDVLQFHGREDEDFCARFGLPYYKAMGMAGVRADDLTRQLARWPSADALLLDGHAAGEPGGSGQGFDWQVLTGRNPPRFLLAGGLDAGNVTRAIELAQPWGVDVSSGIESSPGIKSTERMRAFVQAVRG